jgi:hypothetical protein
VFSARWQGEADPFGNCPICGALLDMGDLAQMLALLHDQEMEIAQGSEPPAREAPENASPRVDAREFGRRDAQPIRYRARRLLKISFYVVTTPAAVKLLAVAPQDHQRAPSVRSRRQHGAALGGPSCAIPA